MTSGAKQLVSEWKHLGPGIYRTFETPMWDMAQYAHSTTVTQMLAATSGLTSAALALARLPGYDLAVLLPVFPMTTGPSPKISDALMRLLYVRAVLGQTEPTDLLLLARRHPASHVYIQMAGTQLTVTFVSLVNAKSQTTTDIQQLRRTLREMEALREEANCDSTSYGQALEYFGALRGWKRNGYAVKLKQEWQMRELFKVYTVGIVKFPEWKMSQREESDEPGAGFGRAVGEMVVPYLGLSGGVVTDQNAMLRPALTTKAQYDLTMILIASRLRRLDHGTSTTNVRDLVPEYLSREPLDPFSGQPYPFDANRSRFYSVGAGSDDHLVALAGGSETSGQQTGLH